MLDEPLFCLELGEPRCASVNEDNDEDEENCFVVNDTGVDPLQMR